MKKRQFRILGRIGENPLENESKKTSLFLLATFIWTWAFYAPLVISRTSPYQFPGIIFLILGGAGPSIVGVLMVLLTYKKEERIDYWKRCFSFHRINWKMWLTILLIFPLIFSISIFADISLGGKLPGMDQLKSLIISPTMIPLIVLISFMSGPWSEEFGWRGVALSPLLKRFGIFKGSIILGLIWGIWHLPLFFMPSTWHGLMGFKLAGFWTFIVFSVGLSMIMTWIYLETDYSILSGFFVHFTSNFTSQLLTPTSDNFEIFRAVLVLVFGFLGCLLVNRKSKSTQELINSNQKFMDRKVIKLLGE
jgi:membrane protease YdiL (CAAX protease family)